MTGKKHTVASLAARIAMMEAQLESIGAPSVAVEAAPAVGELEEYDPGKLEAAIQVIDAGIHGNIDALAEQLQGDFGLEHDFNPETGQADNPWITVKMLGLEAQGLKTLYGAIDNWRKCARRTLSAIAA